MALSVRPTVIVALAIGIASCSAEAGPGPVFAGHTPPDPDAAAPGSVEQGEEIFTQYCVSCHPPGDIVDGSPEGLAEVLSAGVMHPLAGYFTEEELAGLTTFLTRDSEEKD